VPLALALAVEQAEFSFFLGEQLVDRCSLSGSLSVAS
jgi:hypothetical protein